MHHPTVEELIRELSRVDPETAIAVDMSVPGHENVRIVALANGVSLRNCCDDPLFSSVGICANISLGDVRYAGIEAGFVEDDEDDGLPSGWSR